MHVELRDTPDPRAAEAALPSCRFCAAPLRHTFVDLGMSPLCESYVPADRLGAMEPFYPLHVRICERCLLVQLEEFVAPEDIFTEYAYFSSYSDSWVAHARGYVEMAVERFGLGPDSLVVELASNDGYLLQHVIERGIPALGIEPAAKVAEAAREREIETVVEFFGRDLAARLVADGRRADLLAANNVMAHVPDLNDFVGGMEPLLAPHGVVTIEVPHLLRLVEDNQFDTIEGHSGFSARVEETKWRLLEFLIQCRREGKRVAGYGAPGKGNTLLNYCGIRTDLLDFTVDRNPYKQGQFLPGTHIPIHHPEALEQARPDFILILPWNLKEEIVSQLSYTRRWGARCVVPIPEVEVL